MLIHCNTTPYTLQLNQEVRLERHLNFLTREDKLWVFDNVTDKLLFRPNYAKLERPHRPVANERGEIRNYATDAEINATLHEVHGNIRVVYKLDGEAKDGALVARVRKIDVWAEESKAVN